MISDNDTPSLTKRVNELLNNGWKLYGSPTGAGNIIAQGMVKYKYESRSNTGPK